MCGAMLGDYFTPAQCRIVLNGQLVMVTLTYIQSQQRLDGLVNTPLNDEKQLRPKLLMIAFNSNMVSLPFNAELN